MYRIGVRIPAVDVFVRPTDYGKHKMVNLPRRSQGWTIESGDR